MKWNAGWSLLWVGVAAIGGLLAPLAVVAWIVGFLCIVLAGFGLALGVTDSGVHPETWNAAVLGIRSFAFASAVFAALFAVWRKLGDGWSNARIFRIPDKHEDILDALVDRDGSVAIQTKRRTYLWV